MSPVNWLNLSLSTVYSCSPVLVITLPKEPRNCCTEYFSEYSRLASFNAASLFAAWEEIDSPAGDNSLEEPSHTVCSGETPGADGTGMAMYWSFSLPKLSVGDQPNTTPVFAVLPSLI
ncbi:Uncharacterised protein [Bifidobacterium longum subsp. infantis]|uniref:Uncharacterized protein n=1 Tax=Bifidobacterium longum subsp. infantis TaxID=1682 RepID=A0A564S501_BIFLI|nr:Uncharacterised protein [Bifidobacterium longum subsp. infantis]